MIDDCYSFLFSMTSRIRLNADVDLDIPAGFESIERYCATLGHKVGLGLQLGAGPDLIEKFSA